MRLNTKCRYGARAVVEIARKYNISPVKRKEIVKAQEITDSYLENILVTLRDSHIICTKRGAKGGFVLNRAPREITLLDIITSLNGPIEPVECVNDITKCHRSQNCVTRPVWKKMKEAVEKVLRDVTIADLVKDLEETLK